MFPFSLFPNINRIIIPNKKKHILYNILYIYKKDYFYIIRILYMIYTKLNHVILKYILYNKILFTIERLATSSI